MYPIDYLCLGLICVCHWINDIRSAVFELPRRDVSLNISAHRYFLRDVDRLWFWHIHLNGWYFEHRPLLQQL